MGAFSASPGGSDRADTLITMDGVQVLTAFRAEAEALGGGVAGVSRAGWDRPTRCEPWSVRELLGHACVVLGWLPGMLTGVPPERGEVSAAEYYRPDGRFTSASNAARVDLARERAHRHASGAALAAEFDRLWREVDLRCREEPGGRVVRTRHGDAMLLTDFMVTRVVELAVHGLDLADALGEDPWLTPAAGDVVLRLLVGPRVESVDQLGWGRDHFLRKATGRTPLTAEDSSRLARLGVHWLALG